MGRPTLKTPEIVEEICERMALGETLTSICKSDHMPVRCVVNQWRQDDEDVNRHIGRARDLGFDAIAEGTIEIADDKMEDPQSRRVRIDTRLKLLAKWDPKRYGERLDIDLDANLTGDVKITIGGNPS